MFQRTTILPQTARIERMLNEHDKNVSKLPSTAPSQQTQNLPHQQYPSNNIQQQQQQNNGWEQQRTLASNPKHAQKMRNDKEMNKRILSTLLHVDVMDANILDETCACITTLNTIVTNTQSNNNMTSTSTNHIQESSWLDALFGVVNRCLIATSKQQPLSGPSSGEQSPRTPRTRMDTIPTHHRRLLPTCFTCIISITSYALRITTSYPSAYYRWCLPHIHLCLSSYSIIHDETLQLLQIMIRHAHMYPRASGGFWEQFINVQAAKVCLAVCVCVNICVE
jgi:hypothetical protein